MSAPVTVEATLAALRGAKGKAAAAGRSVQSKSGRARAPAVEPEAPAVKARRKPAPRKR